MLDIYSYEHFRLDFTFWTITVMDLLLCTIVTDLGNPKSCRSREYLVIQCIITTS